MLLRPDKIRTRHASDSLFYPPLARVFPGALLFPGGKARFPFSFVGGRRRPDKERGTRTKSRRGDSSVEGKITGGEGKERERELYLRILWKMRRKRERIGWTKGEFRSRRGRRICERRQLSRGRRGGRSSIELRAH